MARKKMGESKALSGPKAKVFCCDCGWCYDEFYSILPVVSRGHPRCFGDDFYASSNKRIDNRGNKNANNNCPDYCEKVRADVKPEPKPVTLIGRIAKWFK